MSYTSRLKKVPVLAVVLILLALAAGAAGTVSRPRPHATNRTAAIESQTAGFIL